MEDMVSSLSDACARGCEGLSHVLCLQDTTEIVFSHEGRLSLDDKDFGYGTSEKEKFCIFAHPGLVVDAASCMPVGYGHIKIWSRDRSENRQKKQRRGMVRLEEKESYRWVETAEKSVAPLPSGRPGYISMKRGLDRFNQHLEIIVFARARDVYKE